MSLRTWLLARLRRVPGDDEGDPAAFVQLTTVAPYRAPVLEEALARGGVVSRRSGGLSPVTRSDTVTLYVRRRDLDEAYRLLARLGEP